MSTRESIAWGVAVGMILGMFTLSAKMRGPAGEAPGEATTAVLGMVVDRVEIPARSDGKFDVPNDRIMNGLLATMLGAAIMLGMIGGTIGWMLSQRRSDKRGEPQAEQAKHV